MDEPLDTPPDKREYLEDGITPKYPRHYNMECEAGVIDTRGCRGPSAPRVTYPPYGTAFTHPMAE